MHYMLHRIEQVASGEFDVVSHVRLKTSLGSDLIENVLKQWGLWDRYTNKELVVVRHAVDDPDGLVTAAYSYDGMTFGIVVLKPGQVTDGKVEAGERLLRACQAEATIEKKEDF